MKKLLKRQMNELKDLLFLSLLRWENLTILPELSIGHHPKIKAYSLIFVLGAENLLLYHIFKPIPTPRRMNPRNEEAHRNSTHANYLSQRRAVLFALPAVRSRAA